MNLKRWIAMLYFHECVNDFLHVMNVSITYIEDYQLVRGTRCEFMRTKFIQRQIQTKHIYITVFPTSETLKQLYKQEQI